MFYTYALLDPRKPGKYFYENFPVCFLYCPFYIGKGKDNRIKKHGLYWTGRNYFKDNTITAIQKQNLEPIELVLFYGSEEDCFTFEKESIFHIGRHPNGPLTNWTDGGEGCSNPPIDVLSKRGKKIAESFEKNRDTRLRIISETLNTPQVLEKRSKTMGSDEIRQKRRDSQNSRLLNSEYRKFLSKKSKETLANETQETRNKRIQAATSDIANEKRSKTLRETWAKKKAAAKVKISYNETMDNQQPH